jgi:predicted nucleic acid-binding protein
VLVFDTSAFLNGRNDHYPPGTFPSVWQLVADALIDGRILLPRAVWVEIRAKDDHINAWIKDHAYVDPPEEVQRAVGVIYQQFSAGSGRRDGADPFVIAEARHRGLTVVTYEGRSFSGVPTKRWERSMPGICQRFGVPCCTLPEALALLGASF